MTTKRTKEYKDTKVEKIVTDSRAVFHCICCNRDFIGQKDTIPYQCPACKNTGDVIVINGNLIVCK